MKLHTSLPFLCLATFLLLSACDRAETATTESGAAAEFPVPASPLEHDMAHMVAEGSADADAAGASRIAAQLAYLFPDGNDRGWTAVAQIGGRFHVMEPDTGMAVLEPAVGAELSRQLNLTAQVVQQYPTVQHAEQAGYRRVGPYGPGFGAHWQGGLTNSTGPLTDEQILRPSSLLYGGISQDSTLVGFMYTSQEPSPDGFAGPNDHWHSHVGVCSRPNKDGSAEALASDGLVSKELCESLGFTYSEEPSLPMLHVWTVPAYTNPLGVFAHANPAVTCKDGTYHISLDWADMDFLSNRCIAK